MQAEHPLGREALEQVIVDHLPTAAATLLGRLEEQVGGTGEVASFGQIARGTEKHGRVPVMAAGMHATGRARRPRRAGGLLDRQGVHVRAQADRRTGTAPTYDRDDASAADTGVNLVTADGAQLLGDERSGLVLLETELGPLVQVASPSRELVVVLGDAVDDRHGCAPGRLGTLPPRYGPNRRPGTAKTDHET